MSHIKKTPTQLPFTPIEINLGEANTASNLWGVTHRSSITGYIPEPLGLAFSGKGVRAYADTRTKGVLAPKGNALIIGDTTITFTNKPGSLKKIGVGEHKTLNAAIQAFTKVNSNAKNSPLTLRVELDFAAFAQLRKANVIAAQMDSEEEQKIENKRAAKAVENFISKLNKELFNLSASVNWEERLHGALSVFNFSFISGYSINRNLITIDFSLKAAEYLVQRPPENTPSSLYAIDERKPNAYSIARALNTCFSQNNNVIRDRENIISLRALFEHTSFKTIEEFKQGKSKRTWIDLVKEPFEECLDELYRVGFLKTWSYSHSRKKALNDKEAADIIKGSYNDFMNLYLCFELAQYPEHDTRVKAIEAAKKKNSKKKSSGSKKKTPSDAEATTPTEQS